MVNFFVGLTFLYLLNVFPGVCLAYEGQQRRGQEPQPSTEKLIIVTLRSIENVENHLMTKDFSHHFYVENHCRKCEK